MSLRTGYLLATALVISTAANAAPTNDSPTAPEVIDGCSTVLTATTVDAANDVDELNCSNTVSGSGNVQPYGGDVFYRVTAPWSHDISILVEPLGDWDVSLYVFTAPTNAAETCVVAADIAGSGIAEMVQFQNDHGTGLPRDFIIGIDSWRMDQAGEFRLNVTCDIAVPTSGPSFSTLKSRFQGEGK